MSHPAILQFERELKARTVDSMKKENFRKFRERLAEGSSDRAEADRLWAECEKLGDAEAGRNRPVMRTTTPPGRHGGGRGDQGGRGGRRPPPGRGDRERPRGPAPLTREDTNNAGGAEARVLGQPFHNPYTFLPFPDAGWFNGARARRRPTPLTQDEIDLSLFTGVVELELETLSPLLTSNPKETSEQQGHKVFEVLAIGDDVIVPASGVRGCLRTLMTILAGGTLGYLDEGAWLVQGRDLPLGPAGNTSPPSVPRRVFLAKVVKPGTDASKGTVKLGQTRLVKLEELERLRRQLPRPRPGERIRHLWLDEATTSISEQRDAKHPWQLKLSGRPINPKGKREGVFLDDGMDLDLAPEFWRAYSGRNRHGDRPELRVGDLVWLEARQGLSEIKAATDIESIQWARWGRRGESLREVVRRDHEHLLPDSFNPDGKVDEVTDLFGQVPGDKKDRKGAAGPIAARIRPENLVFCDAVSKSRLLRGVTLAPLAPPHPGCAAFYRNETNPDRVTNSKKALRGYKVYRTTTEQGNAAPWRYETQGVYGNDGKIKDSKQRVNKTCDLVNVGTAGRLRISCRSLSNRELGLLLLACSVDWRLGGGKPLGLGHCRVKRVIIRDEFGTERSRMERAGEAPAGLPEPYGSEVSDLLERRHAWHQSQLPAPKLRYPRAVSENRQGKSRGGHVWFARHANPKKSAEPDRAPVALEVLWAEGELEGKAGKNRVKAQPLPSFSPADPTSDCLHGHDLFAGDDESWRRQAGDKRTFFKKLEPFDEQKHARASDRSGGEQGQSRNTRRDDRKRRGGR